MDINLGEEGRTRLVNFCIQIKEIINNDEINHLVSGGNSGISLHEITLMIFDLLEKPRPKILNVPFYRYYPNHRDDENFKFDYSYYAEEVDEYIRNVKRGGKFLFVDDEISQGNTALGIYKLIENSLKQNNLSPIEKYYIVAEDQGFRIPNDLRNIVFKPFAKEIDGYNNLIFTFIPSEFENPIVDYFGDDDKIAFHLRTNILLNIPVKDFNNGRPVFSDKFLIEGRKNIANFEDLQNGFREYLESEIKKVIL